MGNLLLPVGVAVFFAGAGASFALGFAGVCRWLKWSPVNVAVNITNPPGYASSLISPPAGTEK